MKREAWAYDAAYREHGRTVYAAALQVLHDPQEAQDCVHDVLSSVEAWQRLPLGTRIAPPFLTVCVRNQALSRSRKARNRERIVEGVRPATDVADSAR